MVVKQYVDQVLAEAGASAPLRAIMHRNLLRQGFHLR
jgi:hypothetical protein